MSPFSGVLLFFSSHLCRFTQQRAEVAKVGLTEAITQKARVSPGGLANQIQTFGMINITETLYVRLQPLSYVIVIDSDTAMRSGILLVPCCQGELLRIEP